METAWAATQDFWKHLVVVEATVLGLTVGFTASQHGAPTWVLASSWVLLLVAIALGCVLLKACLDVSFDSVLRTYRFNSDIAGIMTRVAEGSLDQQSEEYRGLVTAAMLQAPPEAVAARIFTPVAKQLAAKYAPALPMSSLINMPERTKLARWLHARWQHIETAFYLFSVLAFLVLVLSAVVTAGGSASIPPPATPPARADSSPVAPTLPPDSTRNASAPTPDSAVLPHLSSPADSAVRDSTQPPAPKSS